jgi:phage/plasmid-like protein (TIGR03299 family)
MLCRVAGHMRALLPDNRAQGRTTETKTMAHNIDMTNGRANIAYLGSRKDVWHRLGQEMLPGQTIQDWANAAGLGWTAVKVQAIAALTGPQWDHIDPAKRFMEVEGQRFVTRSDNGRPLGYVSDQYQPVQPVEVLEWFQHYISQDDRFALDVAGSLKNGEIIWATASFRDAVQVVGEDHKARLLMTTTFDGSGSTINKATMTRVVCNNTLDAALSDRKATIRTRHNTKFNADRVRAELGAIAAGFEHYKVMAEAMVARDLPPSDISAFFKGLLDIQFDAKQEDISTRKMNQFRALSDAYRETVQEGTPAGTAWTALNAVTRYVDHDKATRGHANQDEARVLSANFGTGAQMKARAVELLLPAFKVPELIAA